MKDYHIYAHYVKQGSAPKTSPKNQPIATSNVSVNQQNEQKGIQRPSRFPITVNKALAVSLATAHKINSYVGELTENRISQRRTQVGLTFAGLGLLAVQNPVLGGIALAGYVGNAAINYQIRIFKENLSADYMRQLSGGTVRTGR